MFEIKKILISSIIVTSGLPFECLQLHPSNLRMPFIVPIYANYKSNCLATKFHLLSRRCFDQGNERKTTKIRICPHFPNF